MATLNLAACPPCTRPEEIRPLRKADLPAVAQLYEHVFPNESGLPPGELVGYLQDVFLANPWRNEELPSLVCERGEKIIGFLGVVPRRMVMNGRPITLAVSSKLMVAPQHRASKVALQLMKRLLQGPQEVTISDLANDRGRKLWQAFGGRVSLLYSIRWIRLLSPTLFAVSRLSRKRGPKIARFLRPLSLLDVIARRVVPLPASTQHSIMEEELSDECLCSGLAEFASDRVLRPRYCAHSIRWLLEITSRRKHHGALQKVAVSSQDGRLLGWFIYHLNPGDVSDVLQVYAHRSSIGLVLDRLFSHAMQGGALALSGRMEPKFVDILSDRHCFFSLRSSWFIAHSRRQDILDAINAGDAFLTRLEGEL